MIFRDHAPKLYQNGFSIFWANGKRPTLPGWQNYRDHQATEPEFESWLDQKPDMNIGIPMGPYNGMVAVDIDFGELFEYPENHEILNIWAEHIRELLPYSPLYRKGKKFYAAYFRYSGQTGGPFEVNGVKVGDFITAGQTIIPPSVHPETHAPYEWITDHALADYDREELQDVLTDFTDLDFTKFKAALSTFITLDAVPRKPDPVKQRKPRAAGTASPGGIGRNNELKKPTLRLFDLGYSVSDAVEELLQIDRETYGENALFSDAAEFPHSLCYPHDRAMKYVTGMFKTATASRKKSGEPMPVPREDRVSKPKPVEQEGPPDWHDEIPLPEAEFSQTPVDHQYPSLADGFHVYDRETEKWVPQYDELSRYVSDEMGLRFRNGYCYIFETTHFVQITDDQVRLLIDGLTLRGRTPQTIQNFFKACVYKCTRPASAFEQPEGFLNCANGILKISDRTLTPHTKDVFFNYVLPHPYDATATCDKWKLFLFETFNGSIPLSDLIGEMFGYVIQGGTPWLHKAFFLVGSGRNGKGVVSEVLKALIGSKNFSAVPIQKLEKEFSAVMIDGKLANIVTELSTEAAQSDIFKTVVAGEAITVSEKNKPQYLLTPHARTIILANQFPRFNDASVGVVDRLCMIPFDNYIAEDKRDPLLATKLIAEISGVLNWALDSLDALRIRGHLPKVEKVTEKLTDYRFESDSVFAFFSSFFISDAEIEISVKIGDVFSDYSDWCIAEGRKPKAKSHFSSSLSALIRAFYQTHLTLPHPIETKPHGYVTFTGRFKFAKVPVIKNDFKIVRPYPNS